jgi:hypothetical protein
MRFYTWQGIDPPRIEVAYARFETDHLVARGTSTCEDYVLMWSLTTGPAWVTRALSVRARGDGWERALDLRRSDDGAWSAAPGEHALDEVRDVLDCDLGLCPFTNTMPVLRHDLIGAAQRGESRVVDLVMAWVAVPELTVHPSPQRYVALGPAADSGARIGFESEDFATTIEFDRDAVVRDYPDLATRL